MKLYFHDFCLIFDDDFATDNQKKRKERKKERKKEKREGGVSLCVRHKEREGENEKLLYFTCDGFCVFGTNTLIIERTDNCFLFHISFSFFFAYNTLNTYHHHVLQEYLVQFFSFLVYPFLYILQHPCIYWMV